MNERLVHGARKGLAWAMARGAGLRVLGAERLAGARGPLIVLSNHGSRSDSAYYIHAIQGKITVSGARAAYFATAPRRALMRWMNVMRADSREQFARDCGERLGRGEVLLMYPEMATNRRGLGPFRDWAAEVALRQGVAALPCYIHGTTVGHRGPVTLVAGDPIERYNGHDAASLTELFRRSIVELAGRLDGAADLASGSPW